SSRAWAAIDSATWIRGEWNAEIARNQQRLIAVRLGAENALYRDLEVPRLGQDKAGLKYNPANETLWMWDNSYLNLYVPETGELKKLLSIGAQENAIRGVVEGIEFDRHGNTWVGTSAGLFLVRLRENPFRVYRPYAKDRMTDNLIWGMAEVQGKLFVQRVEQEIFSLEPASGELTQIFGKPVAGGKSIPLKAGVEIIAHQDSLALAMRHHVRIFDPEQGTFRDIHAAKRPIGRIWALFSDDQGRLWIGTRDDEFWMYRWDPELDSLVPEVNFLPGAKGDFIRTHVIDQLDQDRLLIGTTAGLFIYDIPQRSFERFCEDCEGKNKLPCDEIYDVIVGTDGKIWMTTLSCGVVRLDLDSGSGEILTSYTTNEGLSSNWPYEILEDRYDRLFITSEKGLMILDKLSGKVQLFSEENGLSYSDMVENGALKGADGTLYFGTVNGLSAVDPEDIPRPGQRSAKFVLLSFKNFDPQTEKIIDRTTELQSSGEIQLPTSNRFFTIEVAHLSYLPPGDIHYSYKIEGRDETWTSMLGNRLQVDGLAYGKYVLHFRAENRSGLYAPETLQFTIVAPRPFFQQPWFLLLCAAVLIMGAFLFFRARTRGLRKRQIELEATVMERTAQISQQAEVVAHQAEELRNLDKVKSRFFANISHELRTPLTLIHGPVSSLLKSGNLGSTEQEHAELIRENSVMLEQLVNEILDLSKLEAGAIPLEEEAVNLHELLSRLAGNFESHSEKEGVKLHFKYEGNQELYVLLDIQKFTRIVYNLLSNAFKYTPPGGRVIVSGKELPDRILVRVSDTGAGIHQDDLPHIFDRFYQSGRPETKAAGGTGIGLALSKELAHLISGQLDVESELEKGSTFSLEIPKRMVEAPATGFEEETPQIRPDAEEEVPAETVSNPAGAAILLVEDNHSLRQYLTGILKPKYRVTTARNGAEAIQILQAKGRFDLILSDIMMPIMDGFELLERLKCEHKWWTIPVVMLTARADMEGKVKALRTGVDDYLRKPFEEEELLARIDNLLKYRPRVQKSEAQTATTSDDAVKEVPLHEQEWLISLEENARKGLPDPGFNIDRLADDMALSRRQLERRVKSLTGLTPHKYVLEIRLSLAREALEKGAHPSVKAVAYKVGYKDTDHFARQYKQRFGRTPSS
ncbi:MAG: response regulator, partial [Bacteroidota bacterium]